MVQGLSPTLLKRALEQAKEGRLHMLFHMLKAQVLSLLALLVQNYKY
jgi:polyribonucleotide nucleotidyltransferase